MQLLVALHRARLLALLGLFILAAALPLPTRAQGLATLLWSTYLGGGGFDDGEAIALDAAGSVYIAGTTNGYAGSREGLLLAKFAPDGRSLLWSTTIGGSGGDNATAIALDGAGNIYLAGSTSSPDFPGRTDGSSENAAFVAKFAPDGLRLLWSAFLPGGNTHALALDAAGNAYLAGDSFVKTLPTQNALQPASIDGLCGGGRQVPVICGDAFAAKINSDGTLAWSTYLSGSGEDNARGITVDGAGNVYVAGSSRSADFPGVVPATMEAKQHEIYLLALNAEGGLRWNRTFGSTGYDIPGGVVAGSDGSIYLAGEFGGADFPLTRVLQPRGQGSSSMAVLKWSGAGAMIWSADIGTFGSIGGIALDAGDNPFVLGDTNSQQIPALNAAQAIAAGDGDLFVLKLGAQSGELLYGSYLGGSNYESAGQIAVDATGRAYLIGLTRSANFSVVNALQPANAGDADMVVAKIDPAATRNTTPAQPGDGSFAHPVFRQLWERTDLPLASRIRGLEERGWIWGPQPITGAVQERFDDGPGGVRLVQYFDKGRMELGSANGRTMVTAGLLVVELISGRAQVGAAAFEERLPADETVAGDPGAVNEIGPTYRSLRVVATPTGGGTAPDRRGQALTLSLQRDGTIVDSASFIPERVLVGAYDAEAGHNIAQVFSDYIARRGLVLEGGRTVSGQVINSRAVLGLPISEPYWMYTKVGGKPTYILVQAFERRVLTYSPGNPAAWRVEMGNVGQHYLRWRYP